MVSFARRDSDARLIAAVSGQTCDRFMSEPQRTQPGNCSAQKHLPQKRGIHSAFDDAAEKLIPQTSVMPGDHRFITRARDGKFLCLEMLKCRRFVLKLRFCHLIVTELI